MAAETNKSVSNYPAKYSAGLTRSIHVQHCCQHKLGGEETEKGLRRLDLMRICPKLRVHSGLDDDYPYEYSKTSQAQADRHQSNSKRFSVYCPTSVCLRDHIRTEDDQEGVVAPYKEEIGSNSLDYDRIWLT